MDVSVDDIGSFPLPSGIDAKTFERAYALSREFISKERSLEQDEFLHGNFYRVIVDSFERKAQTGLDVINYPQHYDMHDQFADVIRNTMNKGTYLVERRDAIIPEVYVIEREGRNLSEKTKGRIRLRVCITGPITLYLKEIGTTCYQDVLMMFADNVRSFAMNSILNSKYVKTDVVSLDEPSLGFQDLAAEREVVVEALERAFRFGGVTKHIHFHCPSEAIDLLEVENLDVLSFEPAGFAKEIETISKKDLEEADKQIRVGIARTDIDSIMAELYDRGIHRPSASQLVESEAVIRRRFQAARRKFGDVVTFAGPACGLGGWPDQDVAELLLRRTVSAAKSVVETEDKRNR